MAYDYRFASVFSLLALIDASFRPASASGIASNSLNRRSRSGSLAFFATVEVFGTPLILYSMRDSVERPCSKAI